MNLSSLLTNSGAKPAMLLVCFLGGVISAPSVGKSQRHEIEVPPGVPEVLLLDEARIRNGVARLTHSNEIRKQAWGAYLVGERRLKDLAPSLHSLLVQSQEADPRQVHCLRLVVFDSLIRLSATVSAKDLLPLFSDYPEQVIILLANSPVENSDALLALAGMTKRGRRWAAVCNLLAETKAPGFAALMLKDLKIEARVHVFEYGSHSVGIGAGVLWGTVACGVRGAPRGFPPVAHYKFENRPLRGAVVLSTGKRPIYYQRVVVSGTRQQGFCRPDSGGNDDLERAEYLAALLETSKEELGFDPQPSSAVIWSDAEQFRDEVERIRKELFMKYDDLVARLVSSRLLSQSEAAGLKPQISITVVDSREKASSPLPEIAQ